MLWQEFILTLRRIAVWPRGSNTFLMSPFTPIQSLKLLLPGYNHISDWLAMNVVNKRFVQSLSNFFYVRSPFIHMDV